jgi:CBS domain-containing protein
MLTNKIGGLPVVANGRVVGMITESDLMRLLVAELSGTAPADTGWEMLVCLHCGTLLRGRSFDTIGSDDQCWHCHYHLHRCESCCYFNGIVCLLDRVECHRPVPGQHCAAFAYRRTQAVRVEQPAR